MLRGLESDLERHRRRSSRAEDGGGGVGGRSRSSDVVDGGRFLSVGSDDGDAATARRMQEPVRGGGGRLLGSGADARRSAEPPGFRAGPCRIGKGEENKGQRLSSSAGYAGTRRTSTKSARVQVPVACGKYEPYFFFF